MHCERDDLERACARDSLTTVMTKREQDYIVGAVYRLVSYLVEDAYREPTSTGHLPEDVRDAVMKRSA